MSLEPPSLPPPPEGAELPAVLQYGRECALVGLFNERAAVLVELDKLAREFEAAGRANTARRVREAAKRIDLRLREDEPGTFQGQ